MKSPHTSPHRGWNGLPGSTSGGRHPAAQECEEVKCKDTYGNCTEFTVAPPLWKKHHGECRGVAIFCVFVTSMLRLLHSHAISWMPQLPALQCQQWKPHCLIGSLHLSAGSKNHVGQVSWPVLLPSSQGMSWIYIQGYKSHRKGVVEAIFGISGDDVGSQFFSVKRFNTLTGLQSEFLGKYPEVESAEHSAEESCSSYLTSPEGGACKTCSTLPGS